MSARRWVLLVGVALLALVGVNLRLTLAIVSPLLPEIQGEYGLSSPVAGLVTTASVLMFGLAAPALVAIDASPYLEPGDNADGQLLCRICNDLKGGCWPWKWQLDAEARYSSSWMSGTGGRPWRWRRCG